MQIAFGTRARRAVLPLAILFFLTVGVRAARADSPASPLAGSWSGGITLPNGDLPIDVSLAQDPKSGAWTGTIDIPAQDAHGLPLTDVAVTGADVSFTLVVPGAPAKFHGTLANDAIAGPFEQGGAKLAWHVKRAAPHAAAPVLPPPKPLTAKIGAALLGRWTGTVVIEGAPTQLAVTLRDDGGLVAGTFHSSTSCVADQPVEHLTLTFERVHFATSSQSGEVLFDLKLAGDALAGNLRVGPIDAPVKLTREAPGAAPAPVAAPDDLPYTEEDVTFPSVPGVTLAGTLTRPKGVATPPVIVLVTGSGAQDRDECLLGIRPFQILADRFARNGIAVLRYDDRGTAKSTGTFATGTTADFADDAEAAVKFLRARKDVDVRHIGILGHSEGGLIGPIVAARNKDVAFIVMMAGPGEAGADILVEQQTAIGRAEGEKEETLAHNAAASRELFALLGAQKGKLDLKALHAPVAAILKKHFGPDELAKLGDLDAFVDAQLAGLTSPWLMWFLAFDPRATLAKVKCPVLAVGGSLDLQVPVKTNLPAIGKALAKGKNRDYQIVELPGLNHLFQKAGTGSPTEYATLPPRIDESFLTLVTTWVRQHTGLEKAPGKK